MRSVAHGSPDLSIMSGIFASDLQGTQS